MRNTQLITPYTDMTVDLYALGRFSCLYSYADISDKQLESYVTLRVEGSIALKIAHELIRVKQ